MGSYVSENTSQHDDRVAIRVALQDFIEFHEVNKTSSYTVRNYRMVLSAFVNWLCDVQKLVYVDELRIKHLRSYVAYLQKQPSKRGSALADSTVHQYALNISVFCHWLEREGLVARSLIDRFELPKVEQREIPALTRDDLSKLLDACEEGSHSNPKLRKALTARNRAVVSLLFDAGIRCGELVGLRLGDIDRDMHLLHVKRKGNKWQQVPVSYEGFKPLHEYIMKHRSYLASLGDGHIGMKKDDPVFLGQNGEPLARKGINRLFERLRKRAGITDRPVYPHQGRRFMATSQLSSGRNPLDVQRQMGHTTLTMTNRYYGQTVEGLKKSHELYSPLRKQEKEGNSSGLGSGYYDE